MQFLLRTIAIAALIALPLRAMTPETVEHSTSRVHKVVFDVGIDGAHKWNAALHNMENVQKSFGAMAIQTRVVAHGKGIGMLLATTAEENPEMKVTVEKLHASGVVFAVCENTMRKMNVWGTPP